MHHHGHPNTHTHTHTHTHTRFQNGLMAIPLEAWLQTYQQQLCQYVFINQMSNANVGPRTTHSVEESQVQAGERQSAGNI